MLQAIDGKPFSVKSVKRTEKKRSPAPPFITSTLQQEFLRRSKLNIPAVKLNVVAGVDDTETIMRLVAAGVGISVISEVAVREAVAEGKLLSFPIEGTMPYHLYFVHKKRYLSPEQAAFRDFVLETIPANGGEDPME